MPRAKAVAAKPAAVSKEPAPTLAPVVDRAPGFMPLARSIENVIQERLARGVPEARAQVHDSPREPSAEEVRAGFRSFTQRVIDTREAEYVPPEERANPKHLAAIEAENLKKARLAFGVDQNRKVVFPSPNMGRQAAEHKW